MVSSMLSVYSSYTLKVGDKVFGFDDQGSKSHAQYMTIIENNVVVMPEHISYAQAAASSEGCALCV